MKTIKIVFLFITLVFSVQVSAQKIEKKAKKITKEMTKVLSLNETESKAIYKIQLEKFKEGKKIRKEYSDKPETKKQKLKAHGSKVYNQLKKLLGKERLKKWRTYKKNKK